MESQRAADLRAITQIKSRVTRCEGDGGKTTCKNKDGELQKLQTQTSCLTCWLLLYAFRSFDLSLIKNSGYMFLNNARVYGEHACDDQSLLMSSAHIHCFAKESFKCLTVRLQYNFFFSPRNWKVACSLLPFSSLVYFHLASVHQSAFPPWLWSFTILGAIWPN